MQVCNFIITSSIDGEENTVTRKGTIDICNDTDVLLRYDEENAKVCITLQKGLAVVDREGDYSLHLLLEQGKTTDGRIGLNASAGNVPVQTHRVKYSWERNVFKLSLGYALLFGEEKQKMQLNIRAQIRKGEKVK